MPLHKSFQISTTQTIQARKFLSKISIGEETVLAEVEISWKMCILCQIWSPNSIKNLKVLVDYYRQLLLSVETKRKHWRSIILQDCHKVRENLQSGHKEDKIEVFQVIVSNMQMQKRKLLVLGVRVNKQIHILVTQVQLHLIEAVVLAKNQHQSSSIRMINSPIKHRVQFMKLLSILWDEKKILWIKLSVIREKRSIHWQQEWHKWAFKWLI